MELLRSFSTTKGSADRYGQALNRLSEIKPDVWLPSRPADGQNANLYGNGWPEIISDNQDLIQWWVDNQNSIEWRLPN